MAEKRWLIVLVTTSTAKANNPAPVSSGKANVKSESPSSNIQAKPKVVGGNADYIAPPKNTNTINTPSAKVDTTPTNKSINSKVNKDVKSVDVETKGTSKKLISSNESFIDSSLESNYANYLARKAKESKLQRIG